MKTKPAYMHVVAGRIKGRRIECPPGEIRPMTSLVKSALFNIIGDCSKLSMLDLFSGSGSIAIEAYSRGLESCTIVEGDHNKKTVIMRNLEHSGFTNCDLIISDVLSYCKSTDKSYDFIMADPPFKWEMKAELLSVISERNILNDNGFLVIHTPKKQLLNKEIGNLYQYDIRIYGLNAIQFFKKINN